MSAKVINCTIFTGGYDGKPDSVDRQESSESNMSDAAPLLTQAMPPRPSIVIDSSQLPIQKEVAKKEAGSKESLHMQSETMC